MIIHQSPSSPSSEEPKIVNIVTFDPWPFDGSVRVPKSRYFDSHPNESVSSFLLDPECPHLATMSSGPPFVINAGCLAAFITTFGWAS